MCCYCIHPCGWYARQVVKSTKDKGGNYIFWRFADGCKLILAFNLRLSQAWFITIWRLCDYSNNITPDVVLTMSHWLLAKLLNFTTDIEDGIGVIGVHTHRTDHTRVRKHQWSIRVCIEFSNKEQMNKKHRLMFETLIQCDINP